MNIRDDDGPSNPVRHQKDMIEKITGSFGKYQFWLCFLIFLTNVPVAFHQMAIIFVAPKTPYTCQDNNRTEACPCKSPDYDTSVFTSTIISKWGLICEKRWLVSFTQTMFQLGTLLGSVLFGMASDRYGRRIPLLVAVVVQVIMGVLAAYGPDYWTFTILRFFIGMSVGGTMVTGFVIAIENVGTEYREAVSALYEAPFNVGHLLLPVFGYFIRDYSMFQLAISVPGVVLLVYFITVPETPRWLIAVRRTDKAIKILQRIAKMNGRPTENIKSDVESFQAAVEKNQLKKGNLLDLFRTPNLRKNTIAMCFNWMTCSYCFYGVCQYVGHLSGDIFVNVAASASVTLVGTFVAIPLLKLIGRRTIVIAFNFICSLCLIIQAVIPEGVGSVVCACIGVVASFIVFVVVYLYCSELFPTVVRNAAIGVSSMMARVGSMVAPFVIDLQHVASWLPPVVFAILPLIAGLVAFLMPETKGCELMTTLEDGERFGKVSKKS